MDFYKIKKSLYLALAGTILFTNILHAYPAAAAQTVSADTLLPDMADVSLSDNNGISFESPLTASADQLPEEESGESVSSDTLSSNQAIDDPLIISSLSSDTVLSDDGGCVIQAGGFPRERSEGEEAAGSENTVLEDLMTKAVDNWDGSPEITIDLTGQSYYDPESLFDSVDSVINHHPEFFILSGSKSASLSGNLISSLTLQTNPEYTLMDDAAFDNKVNSILKNVKSSWTNLQKAIYIHDWLVTNVQYDLSYSKYSAYDAIVGGSSVCQGYALAYDYLMDRVSSGFSCDVVTSWDLNHAWNTLFLDGKRYYTDCTWDDPISGSSHMYKAYCGHRNCIVSRSGMISTGHNTSDWTDSSGNNIYNSSTGNTYDNASWIESRSKIPMIANSGAFIIYDSDTYETVVYLRDFKAGTESMIFSAGSSWDSNDGSALSDISSADVVGSYYAISAPRVIYLLDTTGAVVDRYDLTDVEKAKGSIFGIEANKGMITYYIQTSYSDSSLVTKGKLDWSRYHSPAAVKGITLDEESLLLSTGDKYTLKATISPHNAFNLNVTWKSSAPSIVSVNGSSTIYGLKEGEAEISVTTEEGGFSDVCPVTVLAYKPAEEETKTCRVRFISGTDVIATTEVKSGDLVDRDSITGNICPEDKSDSIFAGWYEDNKSLWNESAPVVHDMDLYSKYLPVTSSDKSASGKDLYINPKSGDTLYLVKGVRYFLNPGNIYTSSDKKKVRVTGKNKLKAQKEGSAEISDQNGITYPAVVIKPLLSAKKLTLLTGSEETLTVDLGGYEDKYNITWESSNDTVARVSGGKVMAMAKGNAVITAYVGRKAFKCKVKVKAAYSNPESVKDGDIIKLAPSQSYTLLYEDDSFSFKNVSWAANMKLKTFCKNKKAIRFETPIVNITSAGKLTAVGEGSILLRATDSEGRSKFLTVSVSSPEKKIIYMGTGKYKSVTYQGLKAGSTTLWLDRTDIAVVRKGSFLGLFPGSATFNASYTPKTSSKFAAGYTLKGTLYVESMSFIQKGIHDVVPTSGRSNRVYNLSLSRDSVKKLTAKGVHGNIKWATSNPKTAFIDEAGLIYSRNPGKAKLTTNVGGKKYTINITVTE